MKKFLCALLAILMISSALVLTACNKEEKLKFGMGVYSYYEKATDADGDTNGKGQAVSTIAAVLLDKDGKIVKCEIDSADNTVEYTSEGKFISVDSFKTKYEKGKDYNMVAYGGAKAEWFEQADAFEKVVIGKTISEVKALVAEGDTGTEEVINAGCTIKVKDFVLAIEKAVNNAKDSDAVAADTLNVAITTLMDTSKTKDAKGDDKGAIELDISFVAAVVNAEGKVVTSVTDAAGIKFTFDAKGKSSTDTKAAISTKLELGEKYGMKSPYGSDKEWFEHAAAFDAACKGKTANEIAALVATNGKPVESLQTAGCTIGINGIVKAAVKAATVG